MIKKHIKFGIDILSNPEKGFKETEKFTFEETVNYYIWLLVAVSIIAGVFNFLYNLIKAAYFDLFFEVDTDLDFEDFARIARKLKKDKDFKDWAEDNE